MTGIDCMFVVLKKTMFKSIINLLFSKTKRYKFNTICSANNLSIDYNLNKNELAILSDIFVKREYSDYFPFYQKVTVLDIGAHYGYFSIFASKNTAAESKILAIEPGSLNFKCLAENIERNKINNIIPLHAAIGNKDEVSKLYLGRTSNNSLISDYSFLEKESVSEKIELKTLETILNDYPIENIDFLKMDCEGGEYSILESLSSETFKKITTISLEFHDLKNKKYNGDFLVNILINHQFKIVKYQYMSTSMGLNYGKIIGTKNFN